MAYINVDEVYILDNTGLQVDMATDIPFVDAGFTDVQKAQARKNIAAGGTNPNLLMNPFFTVNQRGVSGAVAGGQYGPDRWSLNASSSVSANMGTGYITLPSGGYEVIQTIEDLSSTYGKQVTYSVLDDTGEIRSATITMPTTPAVQNYINTTINGVRLRLRYLNPNWRVFMDAQDGAAHTIKAAKLELGSVSTLANDTAPDYGTELRKCQRYFRRLSGTIYYLLMGFSVDATKVDVPMPLGAHTFAKTPNISMVGTHQVRYNGTIYSVSSMSVQENAEHIVTALRMTTNATGMTGYTTVYYGANGSTSYIDFSAEPQ